MHGDPEFTDQFNTRIAQRWPQKARFREILFQGKVWSAWDQDARAFREIKVRKMRRKHARNAAAWLEHNSKQIVRIVLSPTDRLLLAVYGHDIETKQGRAAMIRELPVYKALVERGGKAKPQQPKLTLGEWATIAGTFSSASTIEVERTLYNKADEYLSAVNECS